MIKVNFYFYKDVINEKVANAEIPEFAADKLIRGHTPYVFLNNKKYHISMLYYNVDTDTYECKVTRSYDFGEPHDEE